MNIKNLEKIESQTFRRLISHLQSRTEVQNIDIMNLTGFCRNCLYKWMHEAARETEAQYIEALGYKVEKVNKVMEGRPHIVDSILNNDIDLIINTTEGSQSIRDSASIRQSALRNKIFCTTTMFGAFAIIDALQGSENDWTYTTLQELNK